MNRLAFDLADSVIKATEAAALISLRDGNDRRALGLWPALQVRIL